MSRMSSLWRSPISGGIWPSIDPCSRMRKRRESSSPTSEMSVPDSPSFSVTVEVERDFVGEICD